MKNKYSIIVFRPDLEKTTLYSLFRLHENKLDLIFEFICILIIFKRNAFNNRVWLITFFKFTFARTKKAYFFQTLLSYYLTRRLNVHKPSSVEIFILFLLHFLLETTILRPNLRMKPKYCSFFDKIFIFLFFDQN